MMFHVILLYSEFVKFLFSVIYTEKKEEKKGSCKRKYIFIYSDQSIYSLKFDIRIFTVSSE